VDRSFIILIVVATITGFAFGWQTPQVYKFYVQAVGQCLYRGQYRQADEYAKLALLLRPLSIDSLYLSDGESKSGVESQLRRFYEPIFEAGFADDLASLGRYAEAKAVILSVPEIGPAPANFCTGPLIGYRQGRLGQAYLGLRQYQEASRELTKPIPNLIKDNGTWAELEYLLAIGYLSQKKVSMAKEVFSKWEQRCDGSSEFEILLLNIPEANDDAAVCIANRIIKYFDRHQPDITTPQCLDFTAAIMETYGHDVAAKLMFAKSHEIRMH
jgi:tetratricopeptide (TPR) repeat protein